ncbi:hypothetical protein MH117_06980 [Paenibacillus sp. ACRRX]|uniref:hypothetical protein n=1 Tax=unclassified Paenibacillus TaxID=185978 RepID=UPI001EF51EF6|nr:MULTISPECIES: hypothetical protein [unclassified Paenibacillus]MCG7407156.1 hypothetical protein [Paenibacillus sp. ACRRX]MDK8180376.1 hypothetical protein [Paenibacillus sp. UMB4589-SE434]
MGSNGRDAVELSVAVLLFVFSLIHALSCAQTSARTFQQLSAANTNKDHTVHSTIGMVSESTLTGADIVMSLAFLQEETIEIVIGNEVVQLNAKDLEEVNVSMIKLNKSYSETTYRDRSGRIVRIRYL